MLPSRVRTILLAAAVLLVGGGPSSGSDIPRVVVVVAGGISIRDIADPFLPGLEYLLETGSAGLMNVRTGRSSRDVEAPSPDGMEPGCVSLGAGTMAVAGIEARRAADAVDRSTGVPAAEILRTRTGVDPGRAEVVHTEIARLRRANVSAGHRASPGALGSALKQAGIVCAVIGNCDLPGEPRREAAAIAMDENGLVELGSVSSPRLTVPDASASFGVRSNISAILAELDRVTAAAQGRGKGTRGLFAVISFGDTLRADVCAPLCLDHRAIILRRRAAANLEKLAAGITARLDARRDLLIILSPNSRRFSEIQEERLAPVIVWGRGFPHGTLSSPSTRTAGVVTISDFAATVLDFFRIEPPAGMIGRPMRSSPRAHSADYLLELNLEAAAQSARQVAMRGGSVVQSIVVLLVTAAALWAFSPAVRQSAAWLALVPAVMPLSMLLLPLLFRGGLAESVFLLALLTGGLLWVCFRFLRNPSRSLAWLCGALTAALMLDVAFGATVISRSIAGYSVIEGARYYGIGNELMGTLLGASLVLTGLALRCSRRCTVLTGFLFAAVLVFIGASGLGANAGGALAAAPAFAAALLVRSGKRISGRLILAAAAAALLLVATVFAADAIRSAGTQSHVGRAAEAAAGGGFWEILAIIRRKIALNIMLVGTSLWSRLLAFSAIGSAALALRAGGRLIQTLGLERRAAAVGCWTGAAAAFLFNDSGVVAAAACGVLAWSMLAVTALEREP